MIFSHGVVDSTERDGANAGHEEVGEALIDQQDDSGKTT